MNPIQHPYVHEMDHFVDGCPQPPRLIKNNRWWLDALYLCSRFLNIKSNCMDYMLWESLTLWLGCFDWFCMTEPIQLKWKHSSWNVFPGTESWPTFLFYDVKITIPKLLSFYRITLVDNTNKIRPLRSLGIMIFIYK